MAEVTYGRLEETLRSLGFSLTEVYEKNKIYKHEETGALVIFPEFPPSATALPRHLNMVHGVLKAYGIAEPLDFDLQLHQASVPPRAG